MRLLESGDMLRNVSNCDLTLCRVGMRLTLEFIVKIAHWIYLGSLRGVNGRSCSVMGIGKDVSATLLIYI